MLTNKGSNWFSNRRDREKGLLLIEKSAEENYRDAIEFLIEHSQDRESWKFRKREHILIRDII